MDHTVRFSEVDAAGIAFFSRVFEWCHHAFEDELERRGLPLSELDQRPWLMPLVHASADYAGPMRLGDRVRITPRVTEVGTTSVTWTFAVDGADGERRATVRHVHVCIGRTTFAPQAIPDDVRQQLEAP